MSLTSLSISPVTTRDVLRLDVVQAGQPEICAGESDLDRSVRWVHISDLPTARLSLRGGELLLSHGLGLRYSREARSRYVEELVDWRTAGLFFELGRAFDAVPQEMIDAAQRRAYPIVALHQRIHFVELTEQVHTMILGRYESRVTEAHRLGRRLTDLAVGGATIRQLLESLASSLEKAVVLEDAAHQIIDSVGYTPDPVDPVGQWSAHSRFDHQPEIEASGEHPSGCCIAAIKLRNEVCGRLHVLDVEAEARSAMSVVIQHAASAMTICFLQDKSSIPSGRYASNRFFSDVLARRLTPDQLVQRGRQLNLRLEGAVAAIAIEPAQPGMADADQARLDETCKSLARSLRRAGVTSAWSSEPQRALICVGAESEGVLRGATRDAIGALSGEDCAPSTKGLCLGVSEASTVNHLSDVLDHAREALGLGGAPDQVTVSWYEHLGLDRLFLRLAKGHELAAFVESELGRLLEHDSAHKTQLLPVLEAYVNAGGSKSDAARALYISRRSLYYKLEVIQEQLAGRDPDDPDTRTSLAVALRALKILRSRSTSQQFVAA